MIDLRKFENRYSKSSSTLILKGTRDDEKREIGFTFSSETEIDKYFFREIISHDTDGMDLSRVLSGKCPLLFNHDPDHLIGSVRSAMILPERVGLANARFSRVEPLATRVYHDIMDDIIRSISFGYVYRDFSVLDDGRDREDKKPLLRARVNVVEMSIVAIPADYSVGIRSSTHSLQQDVHDDRSIDRGETNPIVFDLKIPDTAKSPLRGVPPMPLDHDEISEILAIGERFKRSDLAIKFIREKRSVKEFQSEVLNLLQKDSADPIGPSRTTDYPDIGLQKPEIQNYSLIRALRASVLNDWSGAGFERECSEAAKKQFQRDTEGFLIPPDILRSNISLYATRADAPIFNTTSGSGLVHEMIVPGAMIPSLRSSLILGRLGITVLDGLGGIGSLPIPKQDEDAEAYWVGESERGTKSRPKVTSRVTLTPKTLIALTQLSRKMILTGTPAADEFAKNELRAALAQAVDATGIGIKPMPTDNTTRPMGICNHPNILSTKPEILGWDEVTSLETTVIDRGIRGHASLKYVGSAQMRQHLKTAKRGDMLAQIWEDIPGPLQGDDAIPDGLVNGYRCVTKTMWPGRNLIFGNWAHLMYGEWSLIEILVNPFGDANFDSGDITIRAAQDMDFQVRYPEAFAVIKMPPIRDRSTPNARPTDAPTPDSQPGEPPPNV